MKGSKPFPSTMVRNAVIDYQCLPRMSSAVEAADRILAVLTVR